MSVEPSLPVIRCLGGCGGTLLSRILSSTPRVLLLSETNPRSANIFAGALNPLVQIRKWHPEFAPALDGFNEWEVGYPPRFGAMLERLHEACRAVGVSILVRDFNYLDFIGVPFFWPVPRDFSLDSAIEGKFAIRDILLVRHPAHQLASLRSHPSLEGLLSAPMLLDGYRSFLSVRPDAKIVRYEDLVARPAETVADVCSALGMDFDPASLERFREVTAVTGNTKRLGEEEISLSPSSPETDLAEVEMARVPEFNATLIALGYQPEPQPTSLS
jgi:hypothetical protein